ncbi:zonular occludens toxin domain-containing protein [Methylomonas rivi]|uniref:Zonular occludens toxin domain-containing protein n=1 Tax=Methylomonas rivi TaxID=2952226 RepID=A0ABT1UAC9_9GAMM|nr:zonular occludens toxin domain-containing protein [Methylomonas sp. WSC-6]MCQ8130824.1 zonular occludens toxin domain-containing protein [Methylomonas sp. WSC-6]
MLLDYCKYDPISETYQLNDGVFLVSNIAGLKLNHINFDRCIQDLGERESDLKRYPSESDSDFKIRNGLYQFFNVPFWEKEIAPKYKYVFVLIDECQRYFPTSARDIPNSVWFWFEYHGHFGAEVFMMTQHPDAIHRRVLKLAENYIEAAPETMRRMSNELRYSLRDTTTNEVVSQSTLRADPRIYKAYKSATHAEGIKKKPSHLTRFYILAGVGFASVLIGGVLFFNYMMNAFTKDKPEQAGIEQPVATAKPWNNTQPASEKTQSSTAFNLSKSGQGAGGMPDFEPTIPGVPESAPAYQGLLKVQSVPILAGCIKSENACKCYTQQATPYPVTWEQCLEHVANLKFNPYVAPRMGVPPALQDESRQTVTKLRNQS